MFGTDEEVPNRRIEIIYKPCIPDVMEWFHNKTDYDTKCLVERSDVGSYKRKLEEIKEWIGMPDLIFAVNREGSDLSNYGRKSISMETHIFNYRWDAEEPAELLTTLHEDQVHYYSEKFRYKHLEVGKT